MNMIEKLAYLNGLIQGLGLDESKKDTKVIKNLTGLLEDMVGSISKLQETVDEMSQRLDEIDEDLGTLEGVFYDEDDECACEHKATKSPAKKEEAEIYYEVTCPTCSASIPLDSDMISRSEIDCPNCGEKLEFDLDG